MHELYPGLKVLGPPAPSWDTEATVVATIIELGNAPLPPSIQKVYQRSDCLTDQNLISLLQMIRRRRETGKPVDAEIIARQLSFVEYFGAGHAWFFKLCSQTSTPALANMEAERLLDEANRRSITSQIESLNKDIADLSLVKSHIRLLSKAVDAIEADEQSEAQTITASSVEGTKLSQIVLPQRKSIIGTFLKAGDVGFIFARRGVGKTLFAFEISHLATCGGRLHNWTSQGGNTVFYVDCEMPWDDMMKRAHGFELDQRNDFHLLSHELLFDKARLTINVALREQQEAITAHLEAIGANLFILDNLSSGISRQDENKALDWEVISNWLLDLRRRGIASIIIHHAGRNNEMRGTSKREDAATWVLRLDDQPGNNRPGEANMISMFTKFRSGSVAEGEPFSIRFVNEADKIIAHTSAADSMDVVIQWVRDGLTSPADIAQEMGLTKGRVSQLASKAIDQGRLSKKGRDYVIPVY